MDLLWDDMASEESREKEREGEVGAGRESAKRREPNPGQETTYDLGYDTCLRLTCMLSLSLSFGQGCRHVDLLISSHLLLYGVRGR